MYCVEACRSQKNDSYADVFRSSIGYNNSMSKKNMYLKTWSKGGINIMADVVDLEGSILEYG